MTESADKTTRPADYVQEGIPQTLADREKLRRTTADYVRTHELVPPLSLDELGEHCLEVLELAGADERYFQYAAILLNNELWRSSVAAVPLDRRLLLLPKCLRHADCPADTDAIGLLCRQCGRCVIGDLKTQADALGCVTLVAEGAAAVMSLVQTGKIEAIIGVSCLASLERIFPCIEAVAAPGVAVPLLRDGCYNTNMDISWVADALAMTAPPTSARINMDGMRAQVESWFTLESLDALLAAPTSKTETLARQWLARSGKRWRPFLAVSSYQALVGDDQAPGEDLRQIALAVECFHKASLIHDDIEDNDSLRYGQKTLHEEYGVPVALNVGDYLLGEGYRLLAETAAGADARAQMLQTAARGHRCLATGQGEELMWMRRPGPLSSGAVLEIFRQKTAPAFEVSLRLGAIYAGASHDVWSVLNHYSEALGIAYQIRDDLDDFSGAGDGDDVKAMRPSLLLAMAYERADGADKQLLESIWSRTSALAGEHQEVRRIFDQLGVPAMAARMLESYKDRAIQSLRPLKNANLKALLRRVITAIFGDMPVATDKPAP